MNLNAHAIVTLCSHMCVGEGVVPLEPKEWSELAKLLMENTENTFVTPVFNGSASLRNAAGQLIENVNKAVRRGQTVDEDYLDSLFSEVSALYRLDQISASSGQADLGPLPAASKALLAALALCWLAMGAYTARGWLQKRKREKG